MIFKLLSRVASRGGFEGKLSVMFFHRVTAVRDLLVPGEPTATTFDAMVGWMKGQLNFLPLDEAVRRLREGTLPPAAAALTFDDGYRDNFEIAVPILERHGVPATFFIASSFLDDGIMWNDVVIEAIRLTQKASLSLGALGVPTLSLQDWSARRQAVDVLLKSIKYLSHDDRAAAVSTVARECSIAPRRDLMMSTEQVRRLAGKGFGVGAHTDTHPILTRLPDRVAEDEIRVGRQHLESIIDGRVSLFAYPNGRSRDDFDERHVQMVRRAGFDAAFTTEPGVSRISSNRFALPRFTPWDRKRWRFQTRLVLNMQRGSHEENTPQRVVSVED